MDTERQERIKDSIDETTKVITNLEMVLQGLTETKQKAIRIDEKSEIQKVINRLNNEITFLEDIKSNDEMVLSIG